MAISTSIFYRWFGALYCGCLLSCVRCGCAPCAKPGLPDCRCRLAQCLVSAGWLKWLVLTVLSLQLRPVLKREGIATNASFAGVLFTGRMADRALVACERHLRTRSFRQDPADQTLSKPLLLLHPGLPENGDLAITIDRRYRQSAPFYASRWRYREYEALGGLDAALVAFDTDG